MVGIERVSYRSGFVEHLEEVRRLPATTIQPADLSGDLLALVVGVLLDLGGTYGDPRPAPPSSTTSYGMAPSRSSSINAPSSCSRVTPRRCGRFIRSAAGSMTSRDDNTGRSVPLGSRTASACVRIAPGALGIWGGACDRASTARLCGEGEQHIAPRPLETLRPCRQGVARPPASCPQPSPWRSIRRPFGAAREIIGEHCTRSGNAA
jgi:hypothetical protein